MHLSRSLIRSAPVSRRALLRPRTFAYTPTKLVRPQSTPTTPLSDTAPTSTPASATPASPYVSPETAPSIKPSSSATSAPTSSSVPEEEFVPEKFDRSLLPSLDIDPSALPEPEEKGEDGKPKKTGAKRTKENEGSTLFDKALLGALGVGLVGGTWWLSRGLSQEERERLKIKPEDPEPSLKDRVMSRIFSNHYVQYLTEPAWTELLPPPIPPVRPYTLLVELDGILTCSKWDKEHGWRTAKRPGTDYFIAYLSQFYEIVLFTTQSSINGAPIAERLDPYGAYMPYRLYRDATRLDLSSTNGGNTVKDLSYLNRDLSKVIMLDTNKAHAAAQPHNALIVPKWDGTPGDDGLVALIPFLESVGIYQPKDVRPILHAYDGKDVAVEYNMIEARRRQTEYDAWAATPAGKRAIAKGESASSSSSSSKFSFSSLFGGPQQPTGPVVPVAKADRPGPPPSYLDQKRAQAQSAYLQEQQYWKANEGEIKRMMEEDRERQIKEMGGGSVLGMVAVAMGGVPPSGPAQETQETK